MSSSVNEKQASIEKRPSLEEEESVHQDQKAIDQHELDLENAPLHWHTIMTLVGTAAWDGTISATQITMLFWGSAIVASIGGKAQYLWLGQAFQVFTAVIGPILARVGDSCGRRYPILLGVGMGAVACIILATAQSMQVAIVGATLFGFSYGSSANVFSAASEILPRRSRGTAQVAVFSGAIVGALLSLFVPGQLIINAGATGHPGWRIAFWMCLGLHIIVFALFFFFYHPASVPNPRGLSVISRILEIDLVGLTLLGCGIVPLMMGLIWGGQTYAWNSAAVISCLVIGVAGFGVLIAHQLWIKKDGILSRELFKNRNFGLALVGLFVEGMVYNVYTVYYGTETFLLWESSPILFATRFASFIFAAASMLPVMKWYVWKYKSVKPLLIGGYFLFIVSVIGLATVVPGSGKVAIFYCVIAGIGFAFPLVLLNTVTQLAVDPSVIGLATALVISARSVGGALGIAIVGAVFNAKITIALPTFIENAIIAAGLPLSSVVQVITGIATENITLAKSAPGATAAIISAGEAAALDAYADSLKYVWIVTAPFVAIGMILMCLLKPISKEMNSVVDRPTEQFKQAHSQ